LHHEVAPGYAPWNYLETRSRLIIHDPVLQYDVKLVTIVPLFRQEHLLVRAITASPSPGAQCWQDDVAGHCKRGDSYLRMLLIHGARAVIRVAEGKKGYAESWLARLSGRRNPNVAAVAQFSA
jgi:hypothetical protein